MNSVGIRIGIGIGLVFGFSGCSHSPSTRGSPNTPEKGDVKLEGPAGHAVEKTEEDERMAPKIQREMNAIFFAEKERNPGGSDAFSEDRMQDLEVVLGQSERSEIKYYRENREFFDRVPDEGGGFRIAANAKRLNPYRWTKVGRRKLFTMDLARVREMIAHPCFSAIEDCGEYASDGEENTPLLEEWKKKYPESEYRDDEDKVLKGYLATLTKYRDRVAHGIPKKAGDTAKTPAAKRAQINAAIVETHIRGVEMLLKD